MNAEGEAANGLSIHSISEGKGAQKKLKISAPHAIHTACTPIRLNRAWEKRTPWLFLLDVCVWYPMLELQEIVSSEMVKPEPGVYQTEVSQQAKTQVLAEDVLWKPR